MSKEYFEVCNKLKDAYLAKGDLTTALIYSEDIVSLTEELLELRSALHSTHRQYQMEAATYRLDNLQKLNTLSKQESLILKAKLTAACLFVLVILSIIIIYKKNKKIKFAQDTARKIHRVIHSH